jgi:hypothetical protein
MLDGTLDHMKSLGYDVTLEKASKRMVSPDFEYFTDAEEDKYKGYLAPLDYCSTPTTLTYICVPVSQYNHASDDYYAWRKGDDEEKSTHVLVPVAALERIKEIAIELRSFEIEDIINNCAMDIGDEE